MQTTIIQRLATNLSSKTSLLLLLFLVCLTTTFASTGDQATEFKSCVSSCQSKICTHNPTQSFMLRLLAWSCEDDCKYECMHEITNQAILSEQEIVQYYGKWPFHRLWGMQEPASVLFSFLNGYMHYRYVRIMRNQISGDYYMKKYYLGYAYASTNTWFWSGVYHSRDFPGTEKMDYFSAGFSIVYSLFFAILRIFRVRKRRNIVLLALLLLLAFLAHISYLTFVTFDYGYNILASGAVGIVNNLMWVWWSARHWRTRPDDAWKPLAAVLYITLAMALEIFDFPPIWGVFDAHSLWHASTIPLIGFWYDFLIEDAKIEDFREKKGKKRLI